MLNKKEKFARQDFSLIKGVKSRKMPCNIGVFSIFPNDFPGKKTIVLSKKNFKTAVARNKHKRLFYNSILEILKEKPEFAKLAFIFYPNKVFSKEELINNLLKI